MKSALDDLIKNGILTEHSTQQKVHHIVDYKKKLGAGSFGNVWLAKIIDFSFFELNPYYDGKATHIAVKELDLDETVKKGYLQSIITEVNALEILSLSDCNQYVSKYYDAIYQPDNGILYLFMEYLPGSNLNDLMKSVLEDDQKERIAKRLVDGLKCIHRYNLAHRDIKPSNVMMDSKCEPRYVDFGLSCMKECSGRVGTPIFTAPEIWLGNVDTVEEWQISDVWSLGQSLYELITGETYKHDVFHTKNKQAIQMLSNENSAPTFSQEEHDRFPFIVDFLSFALIPNVRFRALRWKTFLEMT